mmetsp:Transcript_71787/g.145662  ORF Transcript_71787/g.145662 Transcript_71787/m.145662 type:complete len:249 (-) Transcript_71787:203-949(-)
MASASGTVLARGRDRRWRRSAPPCVVLARPVGDDQNRREKMRKTFLFSGVVLGQPVHLAQVVKENHAKSNAAVDVVPVRIVLLWRMLEFRPVLENELVKKESSVDNLGSVFSVERIVRVGGHRTCCDCLEVVRQGEVEEDDHIKYGSDFVVVFRDPNRSVVDVVFVPVISGGSSFNGDRVFHVFVCPSGAGLVATRLVSIIVLLLLGSRIGDKSGQIFGSGGVWFNSCWYFYSSSFAAVTDVSAVISG